MFHIKNIKKNQNQLKKALLMAQNAAHLSAQHILAEYLKQYPQYKKEQTSKTFFEKYLF